MVSTEVRASDVASTSRLGSSTKRRNHQRRVGQITLDFGDHAELDITGCAVQSRCGRLGSFHETVQQRQERLESVRRKNGSWEEVQKLTPPSECVVVKKVQNWQQESTIDRARAAIKIQRAYRAHRAVKILDELEQRIRSAFNPPNDSRTALSYLRARSAELAALRAFMSPATYIRNNSRVRSALQRVSVTLERSLERAKREQEECESGTIVVHVHEVDAHSACSSSLDHGSGYSIASYVSDKKDDKMGRTPVSELPVISEEDLAIGSGVPGKPDDISEGRRTALAILRSSPTQRQEWVGRILAAKALHHPHRHTTVSKVPTLLTIPEGTETGLGV